MTTMALPKCDLRFGRSSSIRFRLLQCAAVVATLQCCAMAQQAIDCSKADSPMERTICGDSALSSLDRELAGAFQQAIEKAGADSFAIRADERRWLADVSQECRRPACIRQAFETRISELKSQKVTPRGTFTIFRLTKISAAYDFVVRVLAHDPEGLDDRIEGPAEVLVLRKGSIVPLQTIILENIFVNFADGKPLINIGPLYQGFINVGDFNFDGQEDFAIQDGNEGSNSQPTYSVFLYSTKRRQFILSHSLSELTHDGRGLFGLDEKKKHLIVMSSSGCCHHESTEYKVQHGAPIPVSRVIADGTKDKEYLFVSHETYVSGGWHEDTTKRMPVVAYSSL
jgi:uncharacterized protein